MTAKLTVRQSARFAVSAASSGSCLRITEHEPARIGARSVAAKPSRSFTPTAAAGRRVAGVSFLTTSRRKPPPMAATAASSWPWPDLDSALANLRKLHDAGDDARRLRAGDRLRLTRREVFAASPTERRKALIDQVAKVVLAAVTASLVLPLLAILTYLLVKAWPSLSLTFLLENPKDYMTAGGIWAPLVGTIYLVMISLALATPIGVLAGVYLNEYAGDNWLTRLVNLAVVNLAGVPSIVHALFGVGAFVLFAGMGRSVLAASCTLAIMTLPVIIASTREALAAVPQSFREACWNMGASRWQTIRTIVLPNSISGILTGVILQVSRAAGETAPILFTGAVFYVAVPDHGMASVLPYGLFDRCMALSYHLFTISTQVTGVSESLQYAVAVVLFGLVLAVNAMSIAFRIVPAITEKMVARMSTHIAFRDVSVTYGTKTALRNVDLDIPRNQIFGIIGPSNSGKTTLLKCINRTIDFVADAKVKGQVLVDDEDVLRTRNVYDLRRKIGMVFPLPVGLPLSIYDNVAYAPRMAGLTDRAELDQLVEKCLRQAALWDEVKDRMGTLGTKLSGGQQQRLTIARALSHRPEILCLDEFSIAVDPVTTMKIEDVLVELKRTRRSSW